LCGLLAVVIFSRQSVFELFSRFSEPRQSDCGIGDHAMPFITRIHGPLTEAEWRASMVNRVVYIKPVSENGERAFSIHAADGTELAIIGKRDSALAAILWQDLEAVSVH
jgi:hypothetical protein